MTDETKPVEATNRDRTFDPLSLYGSPRWCAVRLGVTIDRFRRMRPELEAIGFPSVDRINDLTIKADVDEWVRRRRRLADREIKEAHVDTSGTINFDKL